MLRTLGGARPLTPMYIHIYIYIYLHICIVTFWLLTFKPEAGLQVPSVPMPHLHPSFLRSWLEILVYLSHTKTQSRNTRV